MNSNYNKYSLLSNINGIIELMPFVKLPLNYSDKYETWNINRSRYDKLALKYYGNPFYDFLITYGNTEFLSEFDIPDNSLIRIPFPLSKAKNDYERLISEYKTK